jgi:uncharacterized membrane protein
MSDDTGISGHTRSVVVTTICCLAGIVAGVVSAVYVGTDPADAASTTTVLVMGAFVLVQYPVYSVVGVDIADFGAKDNLYVAFMTFTLWFISYTVLLTSAVTF